MPTTESSVQLETDRDRDVERERDRDNDRTDRSEKGNSKQKSPSSASKAKDLSHVPCKFFKVGGCTAGSSCPFSHSSVEGGGQKETCTWFVKGNCKFGHKCALAHILPGQSMAMDRKNKKAAQAAAAATGGGSKEPKALRGKREVQGVTGGGASSAGRNSLLTGGSTAPTRLLNSVSAGVSPTGRPPMNMPLKATISPSAPAPPLKDTDFASFAALDEIEDSKLSGPLTHPKHKDASLNDSLITADDAPTIDVKPSSTDSTSTTQAKITASPLPLPPSAPRTSSNSSARDFGPIGSPPNYRPQPTQHVSSPRLNGNAGTFSPGTSPRAHLNGVNMGSMGTSPNTQGFLSSSPFSAPGSQSVFMPASYAAGGMAASLGSGLAMMGGRKGWGDAGDSAASSMGAAGLGGMLPATQARSAGLSGRREYDVSYEYEEYGNKAGRGRRAARGMEIAVEDEDLEDFLPSSLTELLTPEERSRRLSRSNSGQGPAAGLSSGGLTGGAGGAELAKNGGGASTGTGLGHRYSRSVPAPSLLGDIKSIWADTSAHPLPSSPPTQGMHRGTPSASFTSRFDGLSLGGVGNIGDEMNMSMSIGSTGAASSQGMMSPSNASAAFLPGLHHQYLNAKAKQAQAQQQAQLGLGGGGFNKGLRGTSGPLFSSNAGPNNSIANTYLQPINQMGLPSSIPNSTGIHTHTHGNTQHTYRTTPSPFDLTQTLHQQPLPHTARPIPSHHNDHGNGLGSEDPMLASHLLSPSTRALQAHAPGQSLPQGLAAGYSRIHALPPLPNVASPGTLTASNAGASPGRGQYSNDWAAISPPASGTAASPGSTGPGLDSMVSRFTYSAAASRTVAPIGANVSGISRTVSGGRYPTAQQQAGHPLSRPAVTGDDDDVFSMDE